jgi:hypothetical protein
VNAPLFPKAIELPPCALYIVTPAPVRLKPVFDSELNASPFALAIPSPTNTRVTEGVALQDGAAPTPPEMSTDPMATSARLPSVFDALAMTRSPCVAALGNTNVDRTVDPLA